MVLERRDTEALHLDDRLGGRRVGHRPVQAAGHELFEQGEPLGRDAGATESTAGRTQHAALGEIDRGVLLDRLPAAHAGLEERVEPLERERLPEEGRRDDGRRRGVQRAQRADEHAVERRVRFAIGRQLIDDLEDRGGAREVRVVLADRAEHVDALDLGHDIEVAPPVALHRDVRRRLEASTEPAPALAHSLGDRPHLPVLGGEDRDDAVGLTEFHGAQDHTLVAVEPGHGASVNDTRGIRRVGQAPSTPPKRRSRCWYSRMAARRSAVRKSGQSTSVKTNSEYADSQSR